VTRLYLPLALDDLRAAWAAGGVPMPDGERFVEAESDDEESEYAALMTAADLADPRRRVVVVAEVASVPPAGSTLPLRRVVAVHADPADRPDDADPDDDLAWYATQEVGGLL
jgi:hypothetical protein